MIACPLLMGKIAAFSYSMMRGLLPRLPRKLIMTLSPYLQEVAKRRTFAIISHPDAGKTTITEKVLLFGQAIQTAGTVKGRGSSQHAKSDWMEMEKQRGISITTSVMQFPYHDCLVNLLDTPGHEDFSEDTYRTLTAVDCCLMVIDAAKGVEDRTRKLMEVTRLRDTPILTFMNKLDRDIRDPMELMDEVENELKIACAPITWPIGCGKLFKGVYHLYKDETYLYQTGKGHTIQEVRIVKGLTTRSWTPLSVKSWPPSCAMSWSWLKARRMSSTESCS